MLTKVDESEGQEMIIDDLIFRLAGVRFQSSKNSPNSAMISDAANLFSKANSSIKIISGGFSSKIYCDVKILNAIRQVIQKKVSVEVAVGPKANKETLKIWSSLGAKIHILRARPHMHYAIIDLMNVRVEKPHGPNHEKQVQYVIYNFKNVDDLISDFNKQIEHSELWQE
jgi:hypothetical protein